MLVVPHVYAEAGIGVLPLNYSGTPLLKHGAYGATTDTATIERWERSWPGVNWGAHVATITVVDADSPAHAPDGNGPDGVTAWLELGMDSGGPLTRTPSGGLHDWYATPAGVRIPSRAGALAPGVDVVAGWGRYVPLPGNVTPRGAYVALRPFTGTLPEAPARLVALAQQRRPRTPRNPLDVRAPITPDSALHRLTRAEPGTRNDTLNVTAYLFGRLVADDRMAYTEAVAMLTDGALSIGLPFSETQATLRSGLHAGMRARGAMPTTDAQERAARVLAWSIGRAWPGRTGSTDRRISVAHSMIALMSGQDVYDASVRRLAELAGVGAIETARKATARLAADYVLQVVSPGTRRGFAPAEYRLCDEKLRQKQTYTQESTRQGSPVPVLGICLVLSQNADVWRSKGLGAAAGIVFDALRRHGPLTGAELAEHTGRSRRTCERALKRMCLITDVATGATGRLVARDGRRWRALDTDLDAIARLLHVDGESERQRARHEREREEHIRSWEIERRRRAEGTVPAHDGTAHDRAEARRARRLRETVRGEEQ